MTSITVCALLALLGGSSASATTVSDGDLFDHIHGGWLGQAIGVTLGGPVEFRLGWPPGDMSYYKELPTCAADQDDIYVELVSLMALEKAGPRFRARDIGLLWSKYLRREALWVANRQAFENITAGILPPASGHPRNNRFYTEIDAQIEADVFGLVAPGMVNTAARNGLEGGHVTNWSDGAYGASFVAACYGAALYARDPEAIVREALATVPSQSQYASMVRRLLAWHKQFPDWKIGRVLLEKDFAKRDSPVSSIINSGAVIIGLLWGGGDFERTVVISLLCGWDCDCNPSTAGGIVGAWMGASRIPARWKDPIHDLYRNSTLPNLPRELTFTGLARRTQAVAERFLKAEKARRVTLAYGRAGWAIPRQRPRRLPYEGASPEQIAAWVNGSLDRHVQAAVDRVAPGWTVRDCGPDMGPGLVEQYEGRRNLLMLHPLSRETPAKLVRRVTKGTGPAVLRLTVASYNGTEQGAADADWVLRVSAAGKVLLERTIGRVSGKVAWQTFEVPLDEVLAGGPAEVTIENVANNWSWEAAYFGEITLSGVAPR